MDKVASKLEGVMSNTYVRFAYFVVLIVLLVFLAAKAGFSLWVLSHIGYERLVNERGMPDFWEISGELDAYKTSQTPGMSAAAQQEHLAASMSAADRARLTSLLM